MYISSGVSNMCLFAPASYYKLNKGFSLGFLFKPLGGLRPPCSLNKKASEKYPLARWFSSIKTDYSDYWKSLISRINEVYVFFDKISL